LLSRPDLLLNISSCKRTKFFKTYELEKNWLNQIIKYGVLWQTNFFKKFYHKFYWRNFRLFVCVDNRFGRDLLKQNPCPMCNGRLSGYSTSNNIIVAIELAFAQCYKTNGQVLILNLVHYLRVSHINLPVVYFLCRLSLGTQNRIL